LYGGIGLTIFLLVQSHQQSYGVIVTLKVRPAMGWEQGGGAAPQQIKHDLGQVVELLRELPVSVDE